MTQPLAQTTVPTIGATAGTATGSASLTVSGFITAILVEFASDAASTTRVKVWDYELRVLLADVLLSALSGARSAVVTVEDDLPTHYVSGRPLTVEVSGANESTSLNPAVLVKIQAAE